MSVVADAEEMVLNLPLRERGEFAARLLASLREVDVETDVIVAEAIRRSEELKSDPSIAISLEELDRRMQERFGWK